MAVSRISGSQLFLGAVIGCSLLVPMSRAWAQSPRPDSDAVMPSTFQPIRVERAAGLWQGDKTYRIGMTLRELEACAGPWPEPLKDWAQYPSGLTVILRDDRVIHLSCTPGLLQGEPWQVMGVQLGTSEASLRQQLGPANTLMARKEAGLTCWVYPLKTKDTGKSKADVGFILGPTGAVEAIMLVERDKLKTILLTRGYSIL